MAFKEQSGSHFRNGQCSDNCTSPLPFLCEVKQTCSWNVSGAQILWQGAAHCCQLSLVCGPDAHSELRRLRVPAQGFYISHTELKLCSGTGLCSVGSRVQQGTFELLPAQQHYQQDDFLYSLSCQSSPFSLIQHQGTRGEHKAL